MYEENASLHTDISSILIISLIIAQTVILEWKRKPFKSFQGVTSLALWLIPIKISIDKSYWIFIVCWTLFSLITGLMVLKTFKKPLQGSTLRLVYKWFYFIYILTSVLCTGTMVAAFYYISTVFDANPAIWMNYGLKILYYGLYFGVLGHDIAEILIFKMAANLEYRTSQRLATRSLDINICGVCDTKLLLNAGEDGIIESTFQLTCGHIFHAFCIQGWYIFGKKQTCLYCKKKVDLKTMFCSYPWKKLQLFYGQLLNWLRWFVIWETIILCFMKFVCDIVEVK